MPSTKRSQTYRSLREWRAAKDLTQRQAAKVFGLSQQGFAKIETGLRHPRPALAARLMQETGVSLESLMGIGG